MKRQLSAGAAVLLALVPIGTRAQGWQDLYAASAGAWHTCAVDAAGALLCWGDNNSGQLGDGSNDDRAQPGAVNGLGSGVMLLSAGGYADNADSQGHTCAMTADATVRCWGSNNGNLGDGTRTPSNTPVEVVDLAGQVTALGTSSNRTCAVIADGSLYCWGDGSVTPPTRPQRIAGFDDVVAVSGGNFHWCLLTGAGAVYCAGNNSLGQLGNGASAFENDPVPVTGVSDAVALSSGAYHNCVLTRAGGVRCWGDGSSGQLGNGLLDIQRTAVAVPALQSGVKAVSAGGYHTCALSDAGAVRCWGWNRYGQLGNNSTTDGLTPGGVRGLDSGVLAITAGGRHSCAVTASGQLRCWGNNEQGQVGDGTTQNRLIPVDVLQLPVFDDRDALTELYRRTDGDSWTDNAGWLGRVGSECSWFGVSCDSTDSFVTGIELPGNNLDGTLPAALGDLDQLTDLSLQDNRLGGAIPSRIGGLAALETLRLDDNLLSGTIPPALGDLANLDFLGLASNQLDGPVPPQLAGLGQLPDAGSGAPDLTLGYNKLFTEDSAVDAFLNAKSPDWAATQTVAPTGVSVDVGNGDIAVSWTPIAYTGDGGAYEVLSATSPDGPYTLAGSTSNKTASTLTVPARGSGANFVVVRTRTDRHSMNKSILTSARSRVANSQCSGSLQTMLFSDSPALALGAPGSDAPDALNGYMTYCHDPVNDCSIVYGNEELELGITYRTSFGDFDASVSYVRNETTDACGDRPSSRPDKDFSLTHLPVRRSFRGIGGDRDPSGAVDGAARQAGGSARTGEQLSFNCLNIDVTGPSPSSSGGCLVDSNGDSRFDSVSVTLTNGMTMLGDLPLYPDADDPTHIEIPSVGLRFNAAPERRRVSVFIPLDEDGNLTVSNGVTGETFATFDVSNGLRVPVQPQDEIFLNGFETVQNALRWLYGLRN